MDEVATAVRVSRDDFKKVTNYRGPDIEAGAFDSLFLRAWKPDGAQTNYQVYVADYYTSEWRFYTSADDSDGTRLNVTLIDREVGSCSRYGGCSHFEHMGINITRDYLERKAESGMTFQISGRGGKEVFFIPGFHIKGFLASTPK